jgi:hypothetical protein
MRHNNYPRGSEWLKWDLHTHTPLDHEWEGKPNSNKDELKKQFARDYIAFAKSEDLSVIAITDHNFCNNIEDLFIPQIQEEAEKENITILPGFEITAKDGSGIHLLVIFRADVILSKIKEIVDRLFLPSTVLVPTDGVVPISNKSIDEIYRELSSHPEKLDFLILFAHIDRSNGVLNKSTITGNRRVEEWKKDFINIAQISSFEVFEKEGFYKQLKHDKNSYYHRDMAYIVASDCRYITKVKNTDGKTIQRKEGRFHLGEKFTWIKTNPTFDGLRQIIYEPNGRIKVQKNKPNEKLASNVIKRVRFVSSEDDNTFNNNWIHLNQDLNTIIGGKSSGKSLLLSLISKTIDSSINITKYKDLMSIDSFDFEVEWNDGVIYKLKEEDFYYNSEDEKEIKRRRISYIPQLAIHKLVEENPEEYRSIILTFLKEKETFKDYYEKFEKKKEATIAKIENSLTELFRHQSAVKREGKELKDSGDKNAKKDELKILDKRIKEIELKELSDEEKKEYEKLKKELEKLKTEIFLSKELEKATTQYNDYISEQIKALDENIKGKHEELTNTLEDSTQTKLSSIRDSLIKLLDTFKENTLLVFKKRQPLSSTLKELELKVSTKDSEVKKYAEKTGDESVIEKLKTQIDTLKKEIKEIEKVEKIIAREKNEILKCTKQALANYQSLLNLFKELSREINLKYHDLIPEDKLTLNLEIHFDYEKFFRDFFDLFDRRFRLNELSTHFSNNSYSFEIGNHLSMIEEVITKLIENGSSYKFKQRNEIPKAIRSLVTNYFSPSFKLKQDNEDIEDMSYGKRSLVLLKLYLALNKNESPIFIDQPEDNLDNRTIYSELKEFMKKKKLQRQIIIVTHNANLVVSTDSELIVVANQDGQNNKMNRKYKFEYITGALENSFSKEVEQGILYQMGIKEHVCDILEGGKKAFKERDKKYGFKQ